MLKICIIEACEPADKGSLGSIYIERHAKLAGFEVDRLNDTQDGYDVEMISLHHANDFPRLAKMKKRAKFRLVGGHPMQNNPLPVIPFADAICVGEGETWIKEILNIIDKTGSLDEARNLSGTIITKYWKKGDIIPATNMERPLPFNAPVLNHEDKQSKAWYIEIARGCPYSCHYCELGHSTKYRYYPLDMIKKAIDMCDDKITRKINVFAPDEMCHPNHAEIYAYIKEKGFYTAAFSSMRIESILRHKPIFNPSHLIRVGIDGMTEETRFKVNKKITDDMIYDYFKTYADREHRMFKIFMVFGYPWETMGDFKKWEKTYRMISSIPVTKDTILQIKWTPFMPQPCTPLGNAETNYTEEMREWVYTWAERNKQPKRRPGWCLACEPIMSPKTHQRQCELTCGDESILSGVR